MIEKKFRNVIISIVVIVCLAMLTLVVVDMANRSRAQIPDLGLSPEMNLVERSGSAFGKSNMLGKISVVNFFFTSCKGPCPRMNGRVAEMYHKFSTSDKVQFVSISVDPARDSLTILKQYAENFGVNDNRWLFLRGEIDEVQRINELGFKLGGELPSLHSTKLILVDPAGKIRGYYDSNDDESLRLLTTHVKELLRDLHDS